MANDKFDAKSFNPQAFKYTVDRVPRTRLNEIRKSRALTGNSDIRNVFSAQNGTAYARIAMRGLLDGDAVNYDGKTDITATSTKTFEQGVVVIGRAKAWTELDFSTDITGGVAGWTMWPSRWPPIGRMWTRTPSWQSSRACSL